MYTYKEYITWDDGIRREIIDGIIYNMASPSTKHQDIITSIFTQISVFLGRNKRCKVFVAPLDVKLSFDKNKNDENIVQPDIFVVCDPNKIGKNAILGVPDFVVEVLSPSTEKKDKETKFALYEAAGVREYWIVDPEKSELFAYSLIQGKYAYRGDSVEREVPVEVLHGLCIDMEEVFYES